MFKSKKYIPHIFLIISFVLLNGCNDHGISTDKVIGEEEIIASQELKLRKYYNRLEERKLSLGLLRQDGGGTDTPFDVEDIVDAFEQLAFYNEYKIGENQLLPNTDMVNLGKWNSNINISMRFGNSVAAKQKDTDLLDVHNLLFILSEATKHKIKISNKNINMYIVVGNQKEVAELTSKIGAKLPEFDPKRIPIITKLPKDVHCLAMTSMSAGPNSEIKSALIIIRSELPKLMRIACFHEEIAQSLGLTNDSHLARPSIFNDDDEFATLTKLDKILLQILYDNRLYSGVSRQNSSEIVRQIAKDIATSINN